MPVIKQLVVFSLNLGRKDKKTTQRQLATFPARNNETTIGRAKKKKGDETTKFEQRDKYNPLISATYSIVLSRRVLSSFRYFVGLFYQLTSYFGPLSKILKMLIFKVKIVMVDNR